MRILIFQHTYFPFIGGAEIAVREITDRLGGSLVSQADSTVPPFVPQGGNNGATAGISPDSRVFKFDLITARLDKNLPKYEKIGNVNVYRVGRGWIIDKYLYPILAFIKAVKLHKEKRYDIAQGIMATWGGIAAMLFKMRHKDAKYLLTMQSGDSDFFIWIRTWFWHPVYKMVYTKADFIQPISRWLEKRARRYGYEGKIKIVPNGVDIVKFKVKSSKFKVRGQMGIGNDEKIIITTSRLVEKNGVEDLIRAIKELRIKNQELRIEGKEVKLGYTHQSARVILRSEATKDPLNQRLAPGDSSPRHDTKIFGVMARSPACAGRSAQNDAKKFRFLNSKLLIAGTGKLEKKLKNLVKELGLQDNVIFLGHISQDDLPAYLWASDVFCRSSISEGQGISFLESMAAGVPIIATPVGGIPDFLEDTETGLFCNERDPKSIADAIIRLLNDKPLYDRIAENGRRLVEERYDWENIAFQMKGIYLNLK